MKGDHPAVPNTQTGRETDSRHRVSRRRVLGGLTACLSLAGCSSLSDEPDTVTSTMDSPSPTTQANTDTETADPTETPTSTPATTTTTSTDTSTRHQNGALIDPSKLTTYTNTDIGYEIKYPAGWTVEERPPSSSSIVSWIRIESSSIFTHMDIYVYSELPSSGSTLSEFISYYLELFHPVYDTLTVNHRQTVTLPGGHTGKILYLTSELGKRKMRPTWLFTIVDGQYYALQIDVSASSYTPTVKQAIKEICTSLTIHT